MLSEKVEHAIESIADLFRSGYTPICASSFGKDSSVMTALALEALRRVVSEGIAVQPMWVATMDTMVENPLVHNYAITSIREVAKFAEEQNLPVKTYVGTPATTNMYLVNMFGGRVFASMPNQSSACSDMMKISTVRRMKKTLLMESGGDPDRIVSLIGKRFDESEARAANMAKRGERADRPVRNEQGDWIMSPIANFTIEDIFEFIGDVRNGRFKTYSDFEDLVNIYRSATGDCMVTAYITGRSSSTSCGSRTGCWICLRGAEDHSMQNMLEETENQFMKGLNDLRNYIAYYHDHPKARNWLARTVNEDGTITIGAGAYSPQFCKELLRYSLTLDAIEREVAADLGIEPRFQTLRPEDVVAISLLHARYGYAEPLMACKEWHEIHHLGKRYPIPELPPGPRPSLPKFSPMRVQIEDDEFGKLFQGLRDVWLATIDHEPVIEKKGHAFYAINTGEEFSVDREASALYLEYGMGLEEDLANIRDGAPAADAFFMLTRKGMITFHKGSHSTQDAMLRLSNAIHRKRLRDILNDPIALVERLGGPVDSLEPGRPDDSIGGRVQIHLPLF
ncbi:phosphoadenosine phosphosulfate reductase family protein [Alcanivorax sp. 1008]|uniref:phosphoadenosine phosphosulfate reductase domain-containing protein n=1 Tax=Alcanivorax sp. 1008 TaxID=2816853 RepID=UPI001D6CDF66|nr:phosphoadenosine phosphosulfate reductase family protein [Alcanivorax sp. 1008]MCC1496892.1 phosphoadenosine phosphosulfate reductase family protein [Alcanivorax sp. 1008]